MHLVEGPVGAGKSTFAKALSLSLRAPHLDLDEWMLTMFSPDRPREEFMEWYLDRKARCIQQIWNVAREILDTGTSVILELGLVQRADRENFYRRVDATDYPLRVYLLDTPLEQRRQRVRERNRRRSGSFKMEVSDEIFDLADSFWEEPTEAECRERNIEIVTPR
ncbi:MAG TPA: AAA family ATPase [Pseudomonadales bacterium]